MFKRALTLVCTTLLFTIFCVRADNWDKKTVVTFSQPVELPGIVLAPGTYVFKLLDTRSDRHIVLVYDKDETRFFTMILALPNYRLEPTGETVMRFAERPKGTPDALRAWFYPGDNFGQEFVYPKARAMTIAEEVKAPVLAAEVTPEAKPEELANAPVETVAPPEPIAEKPAERAIAPEAPPSIQLEPSAVPVTPELPRTASPIPLLALLGIAALCLALLLKRSS